MSDSWSNRSLGVTEGSAQSEPTSSDLQGLVARFSNRNVVVVGDAILDAYLRGNASKVCRESPVLILDLEQSDYAPGGAGNVAVNVKTLGGRPTFLSVVGEDRDGDLFRQSLAARGVPNDMVFRDRLRRTVIKRRLLATEHLLLRVDEGAPDPLSREVEARFIETLPGVVQSADAVFVSDYGYGTLSPPVIELLSKLRQESDVPWIVDSRFRFRELAQLRPTFVKPNFDEACALLKGVHIDRCRRRAEVVLEHGADILSATAAHYAMVSLDKEGGILFERGKAPYRTFGKSVSQAQAAGAGDTFLSAVALALAAESGPRSAAELGSHAAAVAVQKDGTASCSRTELFEELTGAGKFVSDVARLQEKLIRFRAEGKRIVFSNGFFDILHSGHVSLLNQAKAFGDVLVVGVNTDGSVRRHLGRNRPLNKLVERVCVLAGLASVDFIVPFEGDTACELVTSLRPDVFVKGSDHSEEHLPEAPLVRASGGQVQILSIHEEKPTARMIQRIASELRSARPSPLRPVRAVGASASLERWGSHRRAPFGNHRFVTSYLAERDLRPKKPKSELDPRNGPHERGARSPG